MLFCIYVPCRDVVGDMMGYEGGAEECRASILKHVVKLSDISKLLEDPTCKIAKQI